LNCEQYFAIEDTEGHNKVIIFFSYPAGTGVRRCWDCLLILVLPNKKWSDGFKWTSTLSTKLNVKNIHLGRSRWPRGLKRRPAATCLLGLWVRILRLHKIRIAPDDKCRLCGDSDTLNYHLIVRGEGRLQWE
jgi:hypothetical protein